MCAQNSRRPPLKYREQIRGGGRVLVIELPIPAGVEGPGIPAGEKTPVGRRSVKREINKGVHIRPLVRRTILASVGLKSVLEACLVRLQRCAKVQRPPDVHVRVLLEEDGGLTGLQSDRGTIEACASGDQYRTSIDKSRTRRVVGDLDRHH